jgi:hypothetical protein
MNPRPKLMLLVLAALLPACAVPATAAKAMPSGTSKSTTAAKAIAREIAALERTTNTLSGKIAALTAETVTLDATFHPEVVAAPASPPTPAPEVPAGGDFTGSFPDPRLLPGTVGAPQLGEGSVGSDQIAENAVRPTAVAPGAIGSDVLGTLSEEDFASAVGGFTLARQSYRAGQSELFELGVPHEQTLTLSANCPGRLIGGGWKLVPGELGAEIMASVPAFIAGGKSPEHDWVVTVHEQFTGTTIRNRLDTSGLCIP